jgi:glycosyltransferase involved in cell wall biosynthesis
MATKKHLVIDIRLYGPKHTGIGRYTKNLLIALKKLPEIPNYKITLIIYQDLKTDIKKDLGNSFHYVITNIKHYSLKEQILLPFILCRLKPDLVHFTHFNKPIFYFGKSVITIHDLIKHFFKGPENSTKNRLIYWPKYFFYRLFTDFTIKHNDIIVPSKFWKDYLIKNFHIKLNKVTTTHEAVDPSFLINLDKTRNLNLTSSSDGLKPSDYIIYTGNLYPYKNIEVIIKALKFLPEIKLKIICARNFFSERIENLIREHKLSAQVEFLGFVPDKDFKNIYSKALALVHPSLMEGFSLTGLEAMALGCPVISSNSSCLPEIYQDSVLYFNPKDPKELSRQIKKLKSSPTLRNALLKKGYLQVQKYSWDKTAQKTFSIYQKLLEISN